MKIKEILKIEDANEGGIYLFRSGIFWRAYNRSAYLIIKTSRPFQPIRKHVKAVRQDVVYIGFPDTILDDVLRPFSGEGLEVRKEKDQVIIEFKEQVSTGVYHAWFNQIGQQEATGEKRVEREDIVEAIKRFPILERTPLETQSFLWELQKKIHGHLR